LAIAAADSDPDIMAVNLPDLPEVLHNAATVKPKVDLVDTLLEPRADIEQQ
jgi:hypothetical protein